MIVLTPVDVAALQRLTMPIAVLVRGAMQEPLASGSAFKQVCVGLVMQAHNTACYECKPPPALCCGVVTSTDCAVYGTRWGSVSLIRGGGRSQDGCP